RVVFAVMVKVAVIWVALATLTLLTVMPVPALTEAPATKLEPVRATATAAPCAPELGAMAVNVGAGGLTLKATAADAPPLVVTVTLFEPRAALAAMPKVAVI